jgi:ABC-type dipeptide/oligopeptide/nickel transport system permease component
MLVFVARRLLWAIPIMLGVLLLTFVVMQALPGGPVDRMVGQAATEAERARLRRELGLDASLPVQFGVYLGNLARGDLGRTYGTREDVGRELASRLPNTLRLAVFSILVATVLGIGAGVASAVWAGRWPDHVVRLASIFGLSTPVFWFGLMLMLLFARTLEWLPPSGDGGGTFTLLVLPGIRTGAGGWPELDLRGYWHLILPSLTLGVRPAAFIGRVTRSEMLSVLQLDFVRTARAKGLSELPVVMRHALSNALIPVVTLIGVDFGDLLAGSVITETVFSYRGIGMYTLEGIRNREYPIVMATVLLSCALFVLANLVVDVMVGWLDPRLRVSGGEAR